ncbi:hypothetical protein PINS_up017180 [Pythium insidiosum]|nr:hypothetical protein PINS_up017180 [Pythium insidiosum]
MPDAALSNGGSFPNWSSTDHRCCIALHLFLVPAFPCAFVAPCAAGHQSMHATSSSTVVSFSSSSSSSSSVCESSSCASSPSSRSLHTYGPSRPTSLSSGERLERSDARPQRKDGMQSVLAGVIAGCVTRSCTSPLDVLKIIIQVNGSVSRSASAASRSLAQLTSGSAASAGIQGTIRDLYSMEGLRGFWKGNVAGCCRLGPYAGAKFFLFDSLQARFLDENPSNVQRAMCGAGAGLIATMGTYPMEVVRTRMITQTPSTPAHLRIHGVAQGLRSSSALRDCKASTRADGQASLARSHSRACSLAATST